jgi:16S rRNA C967 or C1407 C5-methylase (RsmB/RsmF family)/NOL1/NOP2/fmu family ribosome biogenesis protein
MFSDFPSDFVSRVLSDEFLGGEKLLSALNTDSPVSIRRNPFKSKADLSVLSPVTWCESAYYLTERPSFIKDPLFHAGAYYPQEAGSMYLDAVLKQLSVPEQPRVLDLCASPGGKSTLLASWMAGKGLLVSNEVIHARSKVLKENMTKWGVSNSVVTSNDPSDFERLPNYFDVIVVDAPCSGEGMFRKDKDARKEWSTDNVQLCVARQKRIVMDVWDALQSGGYLVYSTCTFNADENENNVRWFLTETDSELVSFSTNELKSGREGIGCYALPSEVQTEGFYIAVLQKRGEGKQRKLTAKKKADLSSFAVEKLSNLYFSAENSVLQWKDFLFSVPKVFVEDIYYIYSNLHTIKLGTEIGEVTHKGWNPKEGLALNSSLLVAGVSRIELPLEQMLSYLQGDTFYLEGKQGYYLVTYQNEPVGWIKHLGNRFNNLYPKEWRIKMRLDR